MSLLDCQRAFRDELIQPDDGAAPSSPGMAVYRSAYRGRLLQALEVSFAQTRRWVGEETFAVAACHYVLAHPPTGWTLDSYGANFPAELAMLFADDPEVGELAWLEWHLQQAFAAPDRDRLDPAALAAAGFGEADWAGVSFRMAAGFAVRPVTTDCLSLWQALARTDGAGLDVARGLDAGLMVWRGGGSPRFRQLATPELQALAQVAAGATLGDLADACPADVLGPWLAQWLGEGLLSSATAPR